MCVREKDNVAKSYQESRKNVENEMPRCGASWAVAASTRANIPPNPRKLTSIWLLHTAAEKLCSRRPL